jgi:hypothetical protein
MPRAPAPSPPASARWRGCAPTGSTATSCTGAHPLTETIVAFAALQQSGKIRSWGVSNFDVDDPDEPEAVAGGMACDQVLYHVQERNIEHTVIPWGEGHGVAYRMPAASGTCLNSNRDRPTRRGWPSHPGTDRVYSCGVSVLPRPPVVLSLSQGREGAAMTERDLTAREDRFLGLCLAAAAIIVIFVVIVSYS